MTELEIYKAALEEIASECQRPYALLHFAVAAKARAALEAGAKAQGSPRCSCQHEIGDSPCKKHPTCETCELVMPLGEEHECTGSVADATAAYLRESAK